MGIYNFQLSAQFPPHDPNFAALYKKAVSEYVVPAYKADINAPLSCANLGSYYLVRREWDRVESLARRAIELTDVNAIASDSPSCAKTTTTSCEWIALCRLP